MPNMEIVLHAGFGVNFVETEICEFIRLAC